MRRSIFILICGLLATGCAASRPQHEAALDCPDRQCAPQVAVASALAFDPHVASPTPVLARDAREPVAFGGFTDSVIESFDIQTDDDQEFQNFPSTYERRVLSDRVGVIFH